MKQEKKITRSLIFVIILLALGFALFGIDRSPITWADEVFYTEPARQLYLGNNLVSPLFFNLRGLDHSFYLHPPVYFHVLSSLFSAFGFSQMTVRLASICFYLVAIFLIFVIIKERLRSRGDYIIWALMGCSLFAFDNTIIQEVRGGRSGALAILLAMASLHVLNKQKLILYNRIFLATILGSLASLTHPALSFLVVGIFVYVINDKNLAYQRLRALLILLLSASTIYLPYLYDVMSNFADWQSQFLSHSAGSVGSEGRLTNLINEIKYKPIFFILLLWVITSSKKTELSSVFIPLYAMLVLCIVSGQSFYKFALPFAYVGVFITLPQIFDRLVKGSQMRSLGFQVALVICLVNYLAFPVARAALTYAQFNERDPKAYAQLIGGIPEHSKILGEPQVYYACMDKNIQFRYPGPLYGLRLKIKESDIQDYILAVSQYRPDFVVLEGGKNPERELDFLKNVSYKEIAKYEANLESRINPGTGASYLKAYKIIYAP